MKTFDFSRHALGISAAAMLAACGGSQQSIPPGAMSQSCAITQHANLGGSWMLPEAKSEDLLYVSNASSNSVDVYSYPKGKLLGALVGIDWPTGECVDPAGDVFIVTESAVTESVSNVYEFAHGGTSPIAVLANPGYGMGCSVDFRTGNLAVANVDDSSNPSGHGDIAIYAGAQGSPTMVYSDEFSSFGYCGYDNQSNLYAAAGTAASGQSVELALLGNGSTSLRLVHLSKTIHSGTSFRPSVQWDGQYMTISGVPNPSGKGTGPVSVYRLKVSGGNAEVVGATKLEFEKNRHRGQIWIYGSSILGADDYKDGSVSTWAYPHGGMPKETVTKIPGIEIFGVTISPAST